MRNFDPDAFRLLLNQGISYKALFTAINEALKLSRIKRRAAFDMLMGRLQLDHLNHALKNVVLEQETDVTLVGMLLEAGAEATYENGVCVKNAACKLDQTTLGVLCEYSGHNEPIFTQAFASLMNAKNDKKWIAFEHVELVQLLIRYGASGPVLDKAMLQIVDHLACKETEADLADILLNILFSSEADVNYENGKAVGIAASRGDPVILAQLLSHGATPTTASLSLSTAIMSGHEEELLLQLIAAFTNPQSTPLDVNEAIPGMPPPMLLCMKSYPDSVPLVDSLVAAGCDLESTMPMEVYADEMPRSRGTRSGSNGSIDVEPVTVLMWALLQPDNAISSDVINSLIKHGGKCPLSL